MIFLVVVIALGISHKQDKRYWVLAASASAFQLFAHILFNGCGSLQNRGFDSHDGQTFDRHVRCMCIVK